MYLLAAYFGWPSSLTICSEKSELTEEANQIIKTIRQMEASLEDRGSNDTYQLDDKQLKITVPLNRCLQSLKEKHNAIARIHRERFEQVKSKGIVSSSVDKTLRNVQNLSKPSNHTLLTLNRPSSKLNYHLHQTMPPLLQFSTFRLRMSHL